MTDNSAAPSVEQEQEFDYPVTIEDTGPAAKKVSVQVPHERIVEKLKEQFKELRQQVSLPGFRPGHAPQKLVEKKFNTDVREQVRRDLIEESYKQVLAKNELEVVGDPDFEAPDKIALPDEGSMSYSFQVEVRPQITLPELKGLKIKKPKVQVTDANVDEALVNLRRQQGTMVPVEDRGAEEGDVIYADVSIKADGQEAIQHDYVPINAGSGRIAGIPAEDLAGQFRGIRAEESRTVTAKVPEGYYNREIAGKEVQIEVKVKDVKRLELPEINEQFLSELGFKTEQEVREALREQLALRIQADVQRVMRDQVNRYLLENIRLDLPAKLSDRQTERIVSRMITDQMMRGVSREDAEGGVEKLRGGAKDEAARELKLFFILQKIAKDQNVDVSEAELNGRIAEYAAQSGRRPEKVKQELAKDGGLTNLYVQMQEQKAIDKILESAQIEEVEPDQIKTEADASA